MNLIVVFLYHFNTINQFLRGGILKLKNKKIERVTNLEETNELNILMY